VGRAPGAWKRQEFGAGIGSFRIIVSGDSPKLVFTPRKFVSSIQMDAESTLAIFGERFFANGAVRLMQAG
jgi:hypothetical protein